MRSKIHNEFCWAYDSDWDEWFDACYYDEMDELYPEDRVWLRTADVVFVGATLQLALFNLESWADENIISNLLELSIKRHYIADAALGLPVLFLGYYDASYALGYYSYIMIAYAM